MKQLRFNWETSSFYHGKENQKFNRVEEWSEEFEGKTFLQCAKEAAQTYGTCFLAYDDFSCRNPDAPDDSYDSQLDEADPWIEKMVYGKWKPLEGKDGIKEAYMRYAEEVGEIEP